MSAELERQAAAWARAIERVADAAVAKSSVEREYRSALESARAAGVSVATIAAAAGVSRQAVRQLLERAAVRT